MSNVQTFATSCVGCQHRLETQQKILSDAGSSDLLDFMVKHLSFLPEPDNRYDPKAIRVMYKDALLGYVPKDKTDDLREFLASTESMRYDFEITDLKTLPDGTTLQWCELRVIAY